MDTNCDQFVYVDHLLAEHRRLERLIHRTLASIPTWEESDFVGWLPAMRSGLEAVRAELAQHFKEEEAGGCVEEAIARCPGVSQEAQAVLQEHGPILAELDRLIALCRRAQPPTADEARQIEHDFRALVRRLRQHEAVENDIMQRAFAVSLENGVEQPQDI